MPDPNSGFQLPSFFWGNDPRVNQQLRQRIALQMMAGNKRPFPKNVGEGLTAIGDSIGEIGMARRLEQGDLAQQDAARAAASGLTAAPPSSASSSYAPTRTEDEPAVKAINDAIRPIPTTPTTPSPDLLSTTPTESQPASTLFSPQTPSGLGGTSPGGMTPAQGGSYLNPNPTLPPEQRVGGAPVRDVSSADDPWIKRSNAIAGIETGGERNPYAALGKVIPKTGDRAYGKYQVMGANVPQWTQAALGQPMTPQQFLANPEAQEAVFKHRFGQYVDRYGDEGAARAWFAGEKGMNRLDASDLHGRLSVKDYGQDFMRRLNQKPRDRVAAAITGDPDGIVRETATAQGGPQQNPTVAAGGPLRATDFSAQSRTPIVPAPQQSQIQPYVMPKPVPPTAPAIAQLSPLGQKALAIINANPNNEYVEKGQIGQVYANEVKRQEREQTYLNEEYKARLEHWKTLDAKHQDWLAKEEERQQTRTKAPYDLAKLAADTAKAQADADAGKVPTTREIGGEVQQYDPVSKTWIKPPGASVSAAPNISEDQAKNLGYYQRGKRALADLGTGSELNNFLEWHASGMPLIGNYLASTKFQEQYNAAKEFAAIVLRRESGAAVSAKETEDVINRYIAKPGTAPEVGVQKQFMREGVLSSIRDALGKATPLAERFDKTFEDERARLAAAKEAAGGKPITHTDLPPVTINSKEEKDALAVGRRYTLPGDKPGEYRVKK